jgi:hypothetical protein
MLQRTDRIPDQRAWSTFMLPAGKPVWQTCWRNVGLDKDTSLPLPVWLRLLLLMALRDKKDVAGRTNARGAYMAPLYLPYGLLAALIAELHYKFFAFNKARFPPGPDELPEMLKQRPRCVNSQTSKHEELARLEKRKLKKFSEVRTFGEPCAYA